MSSSLTRGAVRALFNEEGEVTMPILQVIDMKILAKGAPDSVKARVILSDGEHYMQGLTTTQMSDKLQAGELKNLSVIRVSSFTIGNVQGRRIVLIVDFSLVSHESVRIGDPHSIEEGVFPGPSSSSSAPSAPTVVPSLVPAPSSRVKDEAPRTGGTAFSSAASRPVTTMGSSSRDGTGGKSGTSWSSIGAGDIQPISSLNQYQKSWKIKARVTEKKPVKEYSNARGSGKLQNVELMDQEGTAIRAVMFGKEVDRIGPMLELGSVYIVSNGKIRPANKKFSTLSNEYELMFDEKTVVELGKDDDAIPSMQFNFIPISSLTEVEVGALVDVLGAVAAVSEVVEVTLRGRDGTSVRRNVTLVSQEGHSVELTLWKDNATQFQGEVGSVVAAKAVRVSEYNGRTLGSVAVSSLFVDPEIDEAFILKGWFAENKEKIETRDIGAKGVKQRGVLSGPQVNIRDIHEKGMGLGDKKDYVVIVGTVSVIDTKRDPWYFTLPQPAEDGSGIVARRKCDPSDPDAVRTFNLKFKLEDATGSLWMTAFHQYGQVILLDHTATELGELKENDESGYDDILHQALFRRYRMRVSLARDTYEDTVRKRCTVQSIEQVDFVKDTRDMLDALKKWKL
eukprot:TRINITY_DN1572_c0_g1_i1.p1 TRINITY_DN1572_c0_g1~~TRINITY_DN1572_c0_g1_i1.p1  ORF type:complete len:622 (-),score=196.08 TRINITY_DN1572_c0_g1_i1:855-2720(-)